MDIASTNADADLRRVVAQGVLARHRRCRRRSSPGPADLDINRHTARRIRRPARRYIGHGDLVRGRARRQQAAPGGGVKDMAPSLGLKPGSRMTCSVRNRFNRESADLFRHLARQADHRNSWGRYRREDGGRGSLNCPRPTLDERLQHLRADRPVRRAARRPAPPLARPGARPSRPTA